MTKQNLAEGLAKRAWNCQDTHAIFMNRSLLLLLALLSLSARIPAQTPPATPAPATLAKPARSFTVQVTGHGKPMLLIPGLSCGGDVWKTSVEHFKDRYECHVGFPDVSSAGKT